MGLPAAVPPLEQQPTLARLSENVRLVVSLFQRVRLRGSQTDASARLKVLERQVAQPVQIAEGV